MTVRAQNQVTILDITDAYSVILSNENQTFREVAYNSGTAAETTTTTVYSYRGDTNVYSYVGSDYIGSTHANDDGVYITIENTKTDETSNPNPGQDLEITIHIPQGLTNSGVFSIPIQLYESSSISGATPLAEFTQDFSYSVAKYGNTGESGVSPTIYELDYTGTLFSFDNDSATYTAPKINNTVKITVTAHSQTGDAAIQPYSGGTITVTPYSANGTAGSSSTNTTSVDIIPSVTSGSPTYLYYIATLTVDGVIVDRQTIGTTRQGANGEDAYAIDITSTNGFVFKNTAISTTLTAHVYSGGTEITSIADLQALGLTVNWYEGSTLVTSNSLTKSYTTGVVTDMLHVTAKLETYSPSNS